MTGNTRMVLNAYQELLNKTYSLVDEGQITRIGKYLNQAECVFVCGKGSFGLAASEMEFGSCKGVYGNCFRIVTEWRWGG